MAENSKIEWTTHTFNAIRGCTKVSPGCANCYAETLAGRNPSVLGMWGPKGTRVLASESQWRLPRKWDKEAQADRAAFERAMQEARSEYDLVGPYERPRVFTASLSDVFEDWSGPIRNADAQDCFICDECRRWEHTGDFACLCGSDFAPRLLTLDDVRRRLFETIDATPDLDWLVLTKRPENVLRMMTPPIFDHDGWNGTLAGYWHQIGKPRENVWLGVSVENQAAADERIPTLLSIPAKVRFLSVEPLLGPVNLRAHLTCGIDADEWEGHPKPSGRSNLHWVIVGGESGPGARPCHLSWIRSIVKQCRDADVACFVKQLGANVVSANDDVVEWFDDVGHLELTTELRVQGAVERVIGFNDKKGGDMGEWPQDLRVREFPQFPHPAHAERS